MVEEHFAVVRSHEWVIEIDFSSPSRVLLSVEGSDASVEMVRTIARNLDAIAIDTVTGEEVDWTGDPSSGLRKSRAKQELIDGLSWAVESNDTKRKRR